MSECWLRRKSEVSLSLPCFLAGEREEMAEEVKFWLLGWARWHSEASWLVMREKELSSSIVLDWGLGGNTYF